MPSTEKDGSLNAPLLPYYEKLPGDSCWWKTIEGLFDLFSIVVFAADVTLDILITIQFYQLQHMTFFWISIALFFISQFVYSALFVARCDLYGCSSAVRTFVCIFPFAQLVPFIIFANSFHWRCMDSLLDKLGLDLSSENSSNRKGEDPLKHFIKVKIDQHGGFVAEALVEALPQSILQVVALVMTNDVDSPLAIISIVLSMVSLASRGVMLSYSLDPWTRIFDIWCFVVDVFSLFATVLWLFFTFQGQELVPVFPGLWEQPVAIVSAWWIYKECVLAGLWFWLGVGYFVCFTDKIWVALVELVLGLVLFVPALIVLEGSRFWLLAIGLSRWENNSMASNYKLFKWLFWFLNTTQTIDGVDIDPGFMEKHRLINRALFLLTKGRLRTCWDSIAPRVLVVTANKSNYSFSALREVNNVKGRIKGLFVDLNSEGKLIWNIWLEVFPFYVVLPFTILSSLLSLAFPLVSFCLTPFEAVPLLHKVISFAYFGSLLVWLLLAIKAFPFLWVRLHIFNVAELKANSAYHFQEDLTHAFNNLRGSLVTQRVLPLPSVLSALVADYAFGETSETKPKKQTKSKQEQTDDKE